MQLTRGARVMLAAALAVSALVGFGLVRTFRSPGLERAVTPEREADVGREPVPPDATMPGAPDSGWPAANAAVRPAPETLATPPDGGVIASVPVVPAAEPRRRAYTDTDLRTIVATRGVAAATHDPGYVLALRQRRVDDLRERLSEARSGDEREKLQDWLDAAQADLERARK